MKQEFYIVQLFPEDAPHLVKLGHSMHVRARLENTRTSCPTAKVIMTWACPGEWESAAIDFIARNCERIGGEVYRCHDWPALFQRAYEFFSFDVATIEKMVATTKRYGQPGGPRRSAFEAIQTITRYMAGEYQPRSRQERHWLRKRVMQIHPESIREEVG